MVKPGDLSFLGGGLFADMFKDATDQGLHQLLKLRAGHPVLRPVGVIPLPNVLLQCLDPDSRCIFILGTMFKVDSRIAGDILGISPSALCA